MAFLSMKAAPTVYDNPPASMSPQKGRSCLSDDSWNNEDNQPSHHQIEEERELFIDFLAKIL